MEQKKRVIIDYKALEPKLVELLEATYPHGFTNQTIKFPNAKGEIITAVRMETKDTIYLVKLSAEQKQALTEAELDDLVAPNEKDIEEDMDEGIEKDEEDDNPRRRSSDDDE